MTSSSKPKGMKKKTRGSIRAKAGLTAKAGRRRAASIYRGTNGDYVPGTFILKDGDEHPVATMMFRTRQKEFYDIGSGGYMKKVGKPHKEPVLIHKPKKPVVRAGENRYSMAEHSFVAPFEINLVKDSRTKSGYRQVNVNANKHRDDGLRKMPSLCVVRGDDDNGRSYTKRFKA